MKRLAAFLIAFAPACSQFGDAGTPEPPPEPRPPSEPTPVEPLGPDYDFTNATWNLSNVSKSVGTISHDGQIALIEGFAVAVFSEPKADDYGDQDIHRSNLAGGEWSPATMTLAATTQLAFPSVAASGGALWYGWTGRADSESELDIWLRRESLGEVKGEVVNITPAVPDAPRESYESKIVSDGGSGVVVLYMSYAGLLLTPPTDYDIRAVTVDARGEVSAATRIFAPEVGSCRNLRAVADASGRAHAVATCGTSAPLLYLSNASGVWRSEVVPMGDSRTPTVADIAVDANGAVHIVWAGTTDCGETICRQVFYSRDLGPEVAVSAEPGFMPVVAADLYGRPVVAFHRNGDSPAVMISHSNDGLSFATPRAVPSDGDRDTSASHLVFDADGRPHLLFDRIFKDSEPLDSDVIHATVD